MTDRDELLAYISDAHKDAYGFRDRSTDYSPMTIGELEAVARKLSDAVSDTIDRERELALEAVAEFEAKIKELREIGAVDRETAVNWYLDSMEMDEIDLMYGDEYVKFRIGLPYDYDFRTGSFLIASSKYD